ncbi:MAG: stage V sporulation protein AB [Acetatifactor sp.]
MLRTLFLILVGASYGMLSSAGVFTVLVAVGLVPRFAGKTHTSRKVILFEEMVIFGTMTGCVLTVFARYCQFGAWWQNRFPEKINLWLGAGTLVQAAFGLFAGMFIGCLALAIAEMLDSIPILARRISFRHGLGFAVLGIALGKLTGSLLYFYTELHRTVK